MESRIKIPKQIVDGFVSDGFKKTQNSNKKILIFGFMAGMFIAFGACCSSAAAFGIANAGLAKLVAGTIFPVGLMLIVLIGGELFTGDCLMIMGCLSRKYTAVAMIKKLVLVFFSNMLGAVLVAMLVYFSGQYDLSAGALGAYTIKVAYGKVSLSFSRALVSGILCNIIVCLAVMMAAAATDVVGKLFGVFFPILAFVIGGFEHCVANMYYIPAGILALQNESYKAQAMELYGYTAEQLEHLNIEAFLVNNLVPVTIGNMIGGMVLVGLPLFLLHRDNKVEENAKNRVVALHQKPAAEEKNYQF